MQNKMRPPWVAVREHKENRHYEPEIEEQTRERELAGHRYCDRREVRNRYWFALNNIPVGVALGVAVGAAIGASLDQQRKRSDTTNDK
jgi:hypothetical protein